ncbi:MAG: type II secretion system minor pseudopilin GspJ [Rhodospirillaceae bacterium]|nr:type II secretion system minor pseudopilin GspJ [Rhodospirillaceae bacterium]
MARGFTLVEVLVALAAFGVLAIAGAGIAASAVDSHRTLKRTDEAVRELQMARAAIKADLGQLVARPVRDGYGARQRWAFAGGPDRGPNADEDRIVLSFVCGGWSNPDAGEPRSSLQYVEYRVANGDLVRVARPFLDATPSTPESRTVLLSDVGRVAVGFVSGATRAVEWRIAAASGGPWPDAVELDLDLAALGRITQLFRVGPA